MIIITLTIALLILIVELFKSMPDKIWTIEDLEDEINKLNRKADNLESHIGDDYHNPLGTAFDVHDSQQDYDEDLQVYADRLRQRAEHLVLLKHKLKTTKTP